MLIYSNQINLNDVLITVHNIYYVELLPRSFSFALYFSYVIQ